MSRPDRALRAGSGAVAQRGSTAAIKPSGTEGHPLNKNDLRPAEQAPHRGKFIYLASPLGTIGGGMFKVADYLIQAQAATQPAGSAQLCALDTRGQGSALGSMAVLATALARIVAGRFSGRLAGVHVNMAERLSVFRKGVLIACCRLLGVPVVLHLHAAQLPQFYSTIPAPFRAASRWVFSLASTVIVLGDTARRFVIDELRVPPDKVELVFNGVPSPPMSATAEQTSVIPADRHRQILFLGNLSERKGVSDLLDALALPGLDRQRLSVTLAGGGELPRYQAKAQALGLEKTVRFTGWCGQAQVAELMAQADLLVLPSYDEGLPLVILEALAAKVAVVCTPVGEIGSVLTHGFHGWLVQPGDVPGLAAGLQRVLDEPGLSERMVHNGRALYEQKFSMSQFFAHIAQIHQRDFGVSAAAEGQT